MEILLGAAVAVVTQLLKKLTVKIGGNWTLLVVFALTVVAAGVYQKWLINLVSLESVVATFGLAVGWYELVLKKVGPLSR